MTTHIGATIELHKKIPVLDHGFVRYVGHMGNDELIVESARMSTGKGFYGWFWEKDTYADIQCKICHTQQLIETLFFDEEADEHLCTTCWNPGPFIPQNDIPGGPKLIGRKDTPRDLSLLENLYVNRHGTPFESGDLMIEVWAPLMVFREWHRHRTQEYNEFSARYAQMPNVHYLPELSRIQRQSSFNKQGSGEAMPAEFAEDYRESLKEEQRVIYQRYDDAVRVGVAKEVARINTPVSRYSRMRAKANLRNWLLFLGLRMEKGAQWEIRQYANALAGIIKQIWPKTFDLFIEHDFLGVRFSRSEMAAIRRLLQDAAFNNLGIEAVSAHAGLSKKKTEVLMDKLFKNKDDDYREMLTKLGY